MIIYIANNEQLPYTSEELKCDTAPMPTRAKTGHKQVGDYYSEVEGVTQTTVVERKSLQDAYQSFTAEKNRGRLYNEICRYQMDERFTRFVIVVEATEKVFMGFFPWAVLKWHKQRGDVKPFCAMMYKKKATVLGHLKDRGAEIIFAGNRENAAETTRQLLEGTI